MLLRQLVFVHKESRTFRGSPERATLKKWLEQKKERELLFLVAGETLHCRIRSLRELKKVGRRMVLKRMFAQCKALNKAARHLLHQPVEEIQRFLQGMSKGFGLFLDPHGGFGGDRGRLNLYCDLLIFWPEITRMQQGEIKQTRRALLDWLEAKSEHPLVDDDRAFYDLCDDIGLVMKPPGPPVRSPVA